MKHSSLPHHCINIYKLILLPLLTDVGLVTTVLNLLVRLKHDNSNCVGMNELCNPRMVFLAVTPTKITEMFNSLNVANTTNCDNIYICHPHDFSIKLRLSQLMS